MFTVLVPMLLGYAGSLATECVSMYNKPCMGRPMLIDLNTDEIFYYPLLFSLLDRCDGSYHTAEGLFGRIWVHNKIGDVNLKVFRMFKDIN